jgi:hypothetical protein
MDISAHHEKSVLPHYSAKIIIVFQVLFSEEVNSAGCDLLGRPLTSASKLLTIDPQMPGNPTHLPFDHLLALRAFPSRCSPIATFE